MPKEVKQQKSTKSRYLIPVIIVIVIALLDQTLLGGNTKYYIKWVQCGQQPVQIQTMPGRAWYEDTIPYPTTLRNTALYCSPFDAEKHGYSASATGHDFPVLTERNALCRGPNDPEPVTAVVFPVCE